MSGKNKKKMRLQKKIEPTTEINLKLPLFVVNSVLSLLENVQMARVENDKLYLPIKSQLDEQVKKLSE